MTKKTKVHNKTIRHNKSKTKGHNKTKKHLNV